MSGWFDRDAVPSGWFDEHASAAGWFDAPQAASSGEATLTPDRAALTFDGLAPQVLDASEVLPVILTPEVCRLALVPQAPGMQDMAPHGRAARRGHRTRYWWDEPKPAEPDALPVAARAPIERVVQVDIPPMAPLASAPEPAALHARMDALERRRRRQKRRDDENLIALLVA